MSPSEPYSEKSVPDQTGRTAFVTGANSGIGYEAARVLAARGARVLLGCRSASKAAAARDWIHALHPKADLEIVALDLASLASIRAAAEALASEERLDLLVNNAGIMVPPREETVDGFESQFGVNHLGHFALTGLLLPKLLATPGARVVSVSSNAHWFGRIDFDDPQARRSYSRQGRYAMSKLANLLFTAELQRRLASAGADTIAVACHPGVSTTELSRFVPSWMQLATTPLMAFAQPPADGALPTLRAATDPGVRGGEYYGPSGWIELAGPPVRVETTKAAQNRDVARRLWQRSIEWTGVEPALPGSL